MTIIGVDIRVLGTGRVSGVEEYTDQLLAHMIPLDPHVQYKLFYAGRNPLVRRDWMDAPNVSIHADNRSNRLLWARTRLTGGPYLDRLVGGADVFFFPHFLVGATSSQCKRILAMHDLSFERFPELFSVGRRFWHRFQMRPRAQAFAADRIVAVSESTRRDIIAIYGIAPELVATVHSGIDPALHRASPSAIERFRVDHGLPNRFILMLGTVEPRKNIACAISAFERLGPEHDDVWLVIAGSRGWLWRGVVAQVERSPRRHRIRFVSEIDTIERGLWLSSASVLAYPSLLEGFGFPPLEAFACGTPVLAGVNSSVAEVCGEAIIAVNPYSVTQVCQALESLLGDQRLRERLVAYGHHRTELFLWNQSARATLGHIFSTLDPRR